MAPRTATPKSLSSRPRRALPSGGASGAPALPSSSTRRAPSAAGASTALTRSRSPPRWSSSWPSSAGRSACVGLGRSTAGEDSCASCEPRRARLRAPLRRRRASREGQSRPACSTKGRPRMRSGALRVSRRPESQRRIGRTCATRGGVAMSMSCTGKNSVLLPLLHRQASTVNIHDTLAAHAASMWSAPVDL